METQLNTLFQFNQPTNDSDKTDVVKLWTKNPNRLLNVLGMRRDRSCTGIVCPCCNSGTGRRGTGMQFYSSRYGNLRLRCFACDANFGPADLVKQVRGFNIPSAYRFLRAVYTQESSPDDDKPVVRCLPSTMRPLSCTPLTDCPALRETFRKSIDYRKACPEWQQRVADSLGLPFSALDRPDLGKSFIVNPFTHTSDAPDPNAGDLVMYNTLNGVPLAAKVRKVNPGCVMHMLSKESFSFVPIHTTDTGRTFRMAGSSGQICFGHDSITADTDTVVIVEGQSDVLAVTARACLSPIARISEKGIGGTPLATHSF